MTIQLKQELPIKWSAIKAVVECFYVQFIPLLFRFCLQLLHDLPVAILLFQVGMLVVVVKQELEKCRLAKGSWVDDEDTKQAHWLLI